MTGPDRGGQIPGVTPVARARPTDEQVFSDLFQEHWTAVHAYARRRTSSLADAHDVAAETFTVAWRRFADVPREHALPWLYRTASNVLANQTRSGRRRDRLSLRVVQARPVTDTSFEDALVEDGALVDAFGALSDDQRELLRLVAWEGLTNPEIAEVLGTTTNAVALRVSRARARLDEELARADATGAGDGGHERVDRDERRTT